MNDNFIIIMIHSHFDDFICLFFPVYLHWSKKSIYYITVDIIIIIDWLWWWWWHIIIFKHLSHHHHQVIVKKKFLNVQWFMSWSSIYVCFLFVCFNFFYSSSALYDKWKKNKIFVFEIFVFLSFLCDYQLSKPLMVTWIHWFLFQNSGFLNIFPRVFLIFFAECFLFVFIMMMMLIRISINQNRYSNHQGCYIHKFPENYF